MIRNMLMTHQQYNSWDIAKAVHDPINNFVSILAAEGTVTSIEFNVDGTKLYIVGSNKDIVKQYDLSTAWDINTATISTTSFRVANQDTTPNGVTFSADGTNMYIVGSVSDSVYQYTLSTAWDVSTAVIFQSFSVTNKDTIPSEVVFSPNGLNMYIIGTSSDSVYQYTLTIAWDISTSVFLKSFSVSAKDTVPTGLAFNSTGTAMYVIGSSSDSIHAYNLSTAWDISTSIFNTSLNMTSLDSAPQAVVFSSDGTVMYVAGQISDKIYMYKLRTAWNITTAKYSAGLNVTTVSAGLSALAFSSNGSYLYTSGLAQDTICQFYLPTAWNIKTAEYLGYKNVSAQGGDVTGIIFNNDGTKMYTSDAINDRVHQYSLSTAWDVSTAIFLQSKDFATAYRTIGGMTFSNDGAKLYFTDVFFHEVRQCNLSIAWDISTAVETSYIAVYAQDYKPYGVAFNLDGTTMYIVGGDTSDSVHQYTLSTAWDVTTAVFLQSFSVAQQDTSPSDIAFSAEGTMMYISGGITDGIYQYRII